MEPNFSGWATKAGLKCTDGRTIMPEAFAHQDKIRVPLVWQHGHQNPENVLGYAILEHRADGVYAHGFFNDTPQGKNAQALVEHGDVDSLSIWANQLVERAKQVFHGAIREVSLVLSGANPGAKIENVTIRHSDGDQIELEDEVIITTGISLEHADSEDSSEAESGETLKDVYDTLSDKQKTVVHYMIGEALEGASAQHSDTDDNNLTHQEGDSAMPITHNVFESQAVTTQARPKLTHDQLKTIVEDAQKMGSFKESFIAHAGEYGITDIELLFPDAKAIQNTPELISRRQEWVNGVISGARKSPFSRIKSLSADITHEEARAKGYIKGNLKKEEFFGLSKRVTTPTTVYKKQKLDRDDIIDITDLDVVAWLKAEMRLMLEEEIARAILISDGREVDDEDKIRDPAALSDGAGIRSIAHDDDFYAHHVEIPANVSGDALIEAILRARPTYRGSGNPTMYCTEDLLTDLLLLKDKMGRRLYSGVSELASELRVSNIVTVDVMNDESVNGGELLAILVNMSDYTIGADKGGETTFFDDFDIDYNQYKYLYETRISGSLTKFKSALVFQRGTGTQVDPTVPTFVPATGVVTIPTKAGVVYKNADTGTTLTAGPQTALAAGATLEVEAVPATGYYFPSNTDADWEFTRPSA